MSTQKPCALYFNTVTRDVFRVYDVSPDGSRIKTKKGWVSAYVPHLMRLRGRQGREFLNDEQVAFALQINREILADKKNKHTGAFLAASQYSIRKWLKGEQT